MLSEGALLSQCPPAALAVMLRQGDCIRAPLPTADPPAANPAKLRKTKQNKAKQSEKTQNKTKPNTRLSWKTAKRGSDPCSHM